MSMKNMFSTMFPIKIYEIYMKKIIILTWCLCLTTNLSLGKSNNFILKHILLYPKVIFFPLIFSS